MPVINLGNYTVAQLQVAVSIVELLDSSPSVVDILRDHIAQRTRVSLPLSQTLTRPCPTSDCPGVLSLWPQSSRAAGVPIIGCLLCRYSMMVGDSGVH